MIENKCSIIEGEAPDSDSSESEIEDNSICKNIPKKSIKLSNDKFKGNNTID